MTATQVLEAADKLEEVSAILRRLALDLTSESPQNEIDAIDALTPNGYRLLEYVMDKGGTVDYVTALADLGVEAPTLGGWVAGIARRKLPNLPQVITIEDRVKGKQWDLVVAPALMKAAREFIDR